MRHWHPVTPEEASQFQKMWDAGCSIEEIRQRYGRSREGVRNHIKGFDAKRDQNNRWVDDVEKRAAHLWNVDGLSASKIADVLNKEFTFNRPMTRNAVIGKARRMGWEGRGAVDQTKMADKKPTLKNGVITIYPLPTTKPVPNQVWQEVYEGWARQVPFARDV